MSNLHIANVLHFYDSGKEARELIEHYHSVYFLNNALSKKGIRISQFQRFHSDAFHTVNNVDYYFIADRGNEQTRKWQSRRSFNRKVSEICKTKNVQLIQAHNAFSTMAHHNLQGLNKGIPYVVQDHSGLNQLKHTLFLKTFLSNIDAMQFSAPGMEQPWVEANVLNNSQCYHIMEASSEWRFDESLTDHSNESASPMFVWVGHLNENKNPLCVLRAFANYKKHNPDFLLKMIFKEAPLENEVKRFLNEHELTEQVKLIGPQKRSELKSCFHEADYFIAASYKEGSGYSLIEALSCGLIPILSEIPSFIELTKKQSIGHLYPCNDHNRLSEILAKLPVTRKNVEEKKEIVSFFQKHFSYEALAEQTLEMYEALIRSKQAI